MLGTYFLIMKEMKNSCFGVLFKNTLVNTHIFMCIYVSIYVCIHTKIHAYTP